MIITFLGSGTSFGVPVIGCRCKVCRSADPKDKRLRPSLLVTHKHTRLLIDASPDFRQQCLTYDINAIDALLVTHAHADHILGLDDTRQFTRLSGKPVDLHAAPEAIDTIKQIFAYAFVPPKMKGLTIPKWNLSTAPEFDVGELHVKAVLVHHGPTMARGYVINSPDGRKLAYIPDCKSVPPEAMAELRGLDALVLDALRLRRRHVSHLLLGESAAIAKKLAPARTYFTHFNHGAGLHAVTEATLAPTHFMAYDGLRLKI